MKKILLALGALAVALGLSTTAFAQTPAKKERQSTTAQKGQVKDPVCGMMIDPKTAAGKAEYKGKTYYFCSREEKEQFEKNPETYVKATPQKKTKKTS